MQNPYKAKSVINPQLENGYRQISTPVFQALVLCPLSRAELSIALVTIDLTQGKTSAPISLSQFTAATNLSRPGVIGAIKTLEEKQVLVVKHGKAPKTSEYLFNEHYDTWPLPVTSVRPTKERIPHKLKWKIWLRDNFTCQHCGSRENLTVDHISPESKGGQTTKDNLQTLCRECNSKKGNKSG